MRFVCLAAMAVLVGGSAYAQPRLRLSTTAIGPVSVAVGANIFAPVVEAANVGSGSLNLTASTTAPWLGPSVGAPRPCSSGGGVCVPISIVLQTAQLARGTYTGTVTVSDPNAIDAPQTITVVAAVGGTIPDSLELVVPPEGTADAAFTTNSSASVAPATTTGGNWLTVVLEGSGSFRFYYPWRVIGRALPGLAEGLYEGSMRFAGSQFAGDNKTVPVRLRVTTQPIAQYVVPGQTDLKMFFRIPGQSAPQSSFLLAVNRGIGVLETRRVAVATATGGNWLSASRITGSTNVLVTATAGSLPAGLYTGTVTIETNGAGATAAATVPVSMEVVPGGKPVAYAGGAINNSVANSEAQIGVGAIVSLFGEQFTRGRTESSTALPLPTALAGTSVFVNGVAAPLFFVSPGQINFQLPYGTAPGTALLQVLREGEAGNVIAVPVATMAPRVMTWSGVGTYGIIVNSDGSLPLPAGIQLGSFPSRPAVAGDALVIYGIGLGPTSPAVKEGAAAPEQEPFARTAVPVEVVFNRFGPFPGTVVPALFSGLTPGFVGLYQVNVIVPAGLAANEATALQLRMAGTESNRVQLATQ